MRLHFVARTFYFRLIALYPDYVAQYWDYKKNNELGLEPDKLTKGSQKEAFFKCPIDGYEWITRIGAITRASWNKGNSGCACCGSGWTLEVIRQFVASLENHIPNLTQAELYKIFEQSGVLGTKNIEGLKIVKDIIKGKLSGQKLRDVIQGKKIKPSDSETNSSDEIAVDSELEVIDETSSSVTSEASQSCEESNNSESEFDEPFELPKVKVQKSLEFLNSKVVASADQPIRRQLTFSLLLDEIEFGQRYLKMNLLLKALNSLQRKAMVVKSEINFLMNTIKHEIWKFLQVGHFE